MSRTERARRRMLRRRRRTVLVVVAVLTLGLLAVRLFQSPAGDQADASIAESESSTATDAETTDEPDEPDEPTEEPSPTPTVTEQGEGTYSYAEVPDNATVIGDGGELMTYNIAVEDGIGEDPDEFAEFVATVFSDDRGWTAAGNWEFEHSDADWVTFTVYLVSPKTRAQLCGTEDTYTSCRNGDAVVINLARWLEGAEPWTAPLVEYREYVINHEVGHRLGEGHVRCPESGTPSPVMAQQTLGLRGCEPNAWPYVDGEYITGPPGEYELVKGHYWDYVFATTGRTGP